MDEKEVSSRVIELVEEIVDIGSAKDLKVASEELERVAGIRHEAEKTLTFDNVNTASTFDNLNIKQKEMK